MISDSPDKVLIGIVILVSGAPFYLICLFYLSKQASVQITLARFTLFIQKLFLCVPETVIHGHSHTNLTISRNGASPLGDIDPASTHSPQPRRTNTAPSFGIPLTEDAIMEEDEEYEAEANSPPIGMRKVPNGIENDLNIKEEEEEAEKQE